MNNSPLATLPAEIRNQIYYLALKRDRLYVINLIGLQHLERDKGSAEEHPLGLAQTCKAMKVECGPVFYAENKFVFKGYEEDSLMVFRRFKSGIGARNLAALRSVEIDVGAVCCSKWRFHHRVAFCDLVAGCIADKAVTPDCRVIVRAVFSYREGREERRIAVGLNVGDHQRSLDAIFKDLSATMSTHQDPRVVATAREIAMRFRDLLPAFAPKKSRKG